MSSLLFVIPLLAIIVQQLVGLFLDYRYSSGTNWTVYAHFVGIGAWFWLGFGIRGHSREGYSLMRWLVYSCVPFCALSWVAIVVGGLGTKELLDAAGLRNSYILPMWGAQQSLMLAFCYFAACLMTRADKWTVICLLLSSYNLISLNKQGVFVSGIVILACALLWVFKADRMSVKMYRLLVVMGASAFLLVVCAVWLQTTASGGVAKDFILKRHFHIQEISGVGSLFSMDAVTTASAGRLDEIWVEAWGRICENPVIGSGFTQTLAGRLHAHNAVLDMLLGMGLLGVIPFFFGNVICMYRGIRGYLASKNELKQGALLSCVLYALSYIAANMGDLQRLWISSSMLYGFCLGAMCGGYAHAPVTALAVDRSCANGRLTRLLPGAGRSRYQGFR